MFRYFPEAYVGETIQSLLYRYCKVYGYKINEVSRIIHNEIQSTRRINSLFGVELNSLSNMLPKDYHLQMEQFYKNHTVMETYIPFMASKEYEKLKYNVQYNIKDALRILSFDLSKDIKWCPQCIEEDYRRYGEVYWHREHQPYGILVCSEHQEMLKSISYQEVLECSEENLYKYTINENKTSKLNNEEMKMATTISKKYKELIDHIHQFKQGDHLQENYFQNYIQYGYVTGSTVKAEEIKQIITSKYNEEFIPKIINTRSIPRYFHNNSFFNSPIYNIFLTTSLFGEEFTIKDINKKIDVDLDELKKINRYKDIVDKAIMNKNIITIDEIIKKCKIQIEYLQKMDKVYLDKIYSTVQEEFEQRLEEYNSILRKHIMANEGKMEIEKEINHICLFLKKYDKKAYNRNFIKHKSMNCTGDEELLFYENKLKLYLEENPNVNRSKMKKDIPSVHKWFMKNNKEILDSIIPKTPVKLEKYRRVCLEMAVKHKDLKIVKTIIPVEYNYLQRKDKIWFKTVLSQHITNQNKELYRIHMRNEIMQYLKFNKTATRSNIQKEKRAAYRWLLENDREWFEENAPKKWKK